MSIKTGLDTGSPSWKYEHRQASALLHNIQNIRICMGKKNRFCNLRKWKDFNKKQLTLLKMCVTSLLCGPRADLWPFYGFLCKRFSLFTKKTERKDRFFSPYKSLYFECCATMPILADAHILSLGYLWCKSLIWESHVRQQIFVGRTFPRVAGGG